MAPTELSGMGSSCERERTDTPYNQGVPSDKEPDPALDMQGFRSSREYDTDPVLAQRFVHERINNIMSVLLPI